MAQNDEEHFITAIAVLEVLNFVDVPTQARTFHTMLESELDSLIEALRMVLPCGVNNLAVDCFTNEYMQIIFFETSSFTEALPELGN